MNKNIEDFLAWYDSLPSKKQAKVDDLADDMGLPLYEDCTEAELSTLYTSVVSNPVEGGCDVKASDDEVEYNDADLYIVRIWYEIDPEHDVAYPQAAQEIIAVFANSPQQAKERALDQWDGPVDRIEIVDINPEDYDPDEQLPFEACNDITASSDVEDRIRADLFKDYSDPETMEYQALLDIDWTDVTAEDSEVLVSQGLPKKPAQVKSISYWEPDEESGYAGGYVVEYRDGNYVIWAWEDGSKDLYCYEQGKIEGSVEASDFLTDEQKEILRKADTSDWSAMQTERTEEEINKAGGYDKWIAQGRKREQSIEGSSSYNNSYTRGVLADCLDNGIFTKQQYDDALNIGFDISGDDVVMLAKGGYLDDPEKIKSIRYVTDKTLEKINNKYDTLYDGGYIFSYRDGIYEWYGFFAGDDDIYFILSNE